MYWNLGVWKAAIRAFRAETLVLYLVYKGLCEGHRQFL